MAKFCANCGNELPENAAMCVKCGTMVNGSGNNKGNKKKGLPTWAIVLIVVGCVIILPILVLVILSIIGINYAEKNGVDIKDYVDNLVTARGTIGDTLTDNELKITLNNALTYSEIEGVLSGTPDDGKEYLVFFFTVENIGDEDTYISTYDFDGYVDDTAIDESVILGTIDGYEEIGGNLAVGKKANGYLAFEVNTNWKKFDVHYKNDYLDSSDSMVFEVVNDDNDNGQNSGV